MKENPTPFTIYEEKGPTKRSEYEQSMFDKAMSFAGLNNKTLQKNYDINDNKNLEFQRRLSQPPIEFDPKMSLIKY